MIETSGSFKGGTHFYSDLSFWALIFLNLIVMGTALIENWSLGALLWIYWSQSASIGILWFFKILMLKDFSTKDVKVNDIPVKPTKETKVSMARFFLLHFGIFHLVYFFFLFGEFKDTFSLQILTLSITFLIYQGFSFLYNRKWETSGTPNIGKLMLFPYARIIPMHATILIGGNLAEHFEGKTVLSLFLVLKITSDVIMHIFETKGFADKGNSKVTKEI